MKKILVSLACLLFCSTAFAQNNISLELKDAPVRTTLEMIFKQANIKNYVIDNSVSGVVTMNLTDQPFENALKLVMRASTIPLTYTKENDVYIVKQRIFTPTPQTGGIDPIPEKILNKSSFERIPLTYIDPADLKSIFGPILFINQFSRFSGGMMGGMGNGNMGGGFGGGFNNNSFGGGGSFGGGMGLGNSAGGMGSFGGMMGGGMGGNGGFGGGRNF